MPYFYGSMETTTLIRDMDFSRVIEVMRREPKESRGALADNCRLVLAIDGYSGSWQAHQGLMDWIRLQRKYYHSRRDFPMWRMVVYREQDPNRDELKEHAFKVRGDMRYWRLEDMQEYTNNLIEKLVLWELRRTIANYCFPKMWNNEQIHWNATSQVTVLNHEAFEGRIHALCLAKEMKRWFSEGKLWDGRTSDPKPLA